MMEEGFDKNGELEKNGEKESNDRQEIYSKAVRAGKRTYFFDVKATRRNDYYLTITESKKRVNREGRFFYEKHKIFLYKEDFEKFSDGLTEVVGYIQEHKPEILEKEGKTDSGLKTDTTIINSPDEELAETYTDVKFEDLDDKTK